MRGRCEKVDALATQTARVVMQVGERERKRSEEERRKRRKRRKRRGRRKEETKREKGGK
jgi:hypothetical protein